MPFSAIIPLWLTFRARVDLGFTLHLASGARVADRMHSGGVVVGGVRGWIWLGLVGVVVCGVDGCIWWILLCVCVADSVEGCVFSVLFITAGCLFSVLFITELVVRGGIGCIWCGWLCLVDIGVCFVDGLEGYVYNGAGCVRWDWFYLAWLVVV